jgi:hypothetical protein
MKKIFLLSTTILLFTSITNLSAQNSNKQKTEKQKADSAQNCKPTKSGKHCAKPSKPQ